MILLESFTKAKLSSLRIFKFKYLLIAYYVLRGAQSSIIPNFFFPEPMNSQGDEVCMN